MVLHLGWAGLIIYSSRKPALILYLAVIITYLI